MPKVGICTHLPFSLILGFDWQQQVQARCTYNYNGALCISTPSSLRLYECIHASKPSINCIASNEVSLPPLEDKWLKQGICHPSNSTYAAPAVNVELPFHESTPRRVVINYSRTINSITKLDPHPIDHMEEVIKHIVEKCYISKVDVKSAFNTIHIREADIFKTGFVTPDGHYEFLRMPFCVTNDPSIMTTAIKLAYEHLAPHNGNTYIDDISISHGDFSYNLKVLYKILEATGNAGFKLTTGETQLAVSEITHFVRILSQDFECPDPDRTASVQRYSTLKSIHENNATIILTDDQQHTFETLRTEITNAPILAYFKQGLPTFLETDASYSGLEAVLSQDQNGKRRVIEYASRVLKDIETCYHTNELECTVVHWALTEKIRLYLLGRKFQLITDNYTTAYVVAKSAVNRKFARYLVDVAQFDFTTVHRPGKSHSFKTGDLVLYDWPKQKDHKLSPIFKGPFEIVRPVGAVCYEIKSRTLQNKFIKVVNVQHLRPYFKRDAYVMHNNTSDEENDSSAENQDSAEDHQEVSVTTEPSTSRNNLRQNRHPPKRFEQYVS
ncbi:retrovirus-related Pol polyprotein from transposon opus [Trichonephila clavipes]|uniref:Retrovirus-related Pol polyprotein from transposon opus n=1 Tax=Trichonephila clavipes TaxID=2585209 RepID=A0A8X6R459_TRICX|nr:retrovirus-related Pol polyprotein from transposon opus [Trichonephila clavipes]